MLISLRHPQVQSLPHMALKPASHHLVFRVFSTETLLLEPHCLSRWPFWQTPLYVPSRDGQLLLLNDSIQLRQNIHALMAPEDPLVPHTATMLSFLAWLSEQLVSQSPWLFHFSGKGQVLVSSAFSTSWGPITRYTCSFQNPLPWCKLRGKFPPP